MRLYRTVFNRQAVKFLADAGDEEFTEIERWVNRIERARRCARCWDEAGDEPTAKSRLIGRVFSGVA